MLRLAECHEEGVEQEDEGGEGSREEYWSFSFFLEYLVLVVFNFGLPYFFSLGIGQGATRSLSGGRKRKKKKTTKVVNGVGVVVVLDISQLCSTLSMFPRWGPANAEFFAS